MAAFFEMFSDMLSFTFMQRALIVGVLVSLCAALLGVNLVLKRYAMIGTGLSHVGFAALAIAGVLDLAPLEAILPVDATLAITMPVIVGTAFLLLRLNESNKINGDSAVALISTSGIAIGVIVVSLTTGLTLHICNIMFGSIFAMTQADMYFSIVLSIVVVGIFVFFYKQLFAVTYDEDFARATGVNVEMYKSLLAILTAVTVVLGMRMMGALLIASLTLFPALSAMRVCKRFLSVVVTAAVIGVACFFVGMLFSFGFDLPPGASVVGVNLVVFILFSIAGLARRGGVV
ncbi:MAG: metal ABC transporter permease [Defluviitaleaceae bacterium]|nr:metal ABC transporter permease [Defluviitaleaceae bacterium]MCL2264052.1 metal ABC transporter permease [Defluviitaleaceae bacterium]